jgi:hypothetical protein
MQLSGHYKIRASILPPKMGQRVNVNLSLPEVDRDKADKLPLLDVQDPNPAHIHSLGPNPQHPIAGAPGPPLPHPLAPLNLDLPPAKLQRLPLAANRPLPRRRPANRLDLGLPPARKADPQRPPLHPARPRLQIRHPASPGLGGGPR